MTDANVLGVVGAITTAAPTPVDAGQTAYLRGPAVAITTAAVAGDTTAFVIDRSGDLITITLLTTDVATQPGSLLANLGNGVPNGTGYLFLDGSGSSFFAVGLDGSGSALSVVIPISGLTVGTHALVAGKTSSTPTSVSVSFTVDSAPPSTSPVTPAYPPAVVSGRWTFQAYDYADPMNIPTYAFATNPEKLEQSFGDVVLTSEHVTANDGLLVVWEGVPKPTQWQFSGKVLTKYDHDALVWWSQQNSRIWLTDEYLRRYLIQVQDLKMTRKRDMDRPWNHDYVITATVLSGQGVMV